MNSAFLFSLGKPGDLWIISGERDSQTDVLKCLDMSRLVVVFVYISRQITHPSKSHRSQYASRYRAQLADSRRLPLM